MELVTLLAVVLLLCVAIIFSPLGLGGGVLYVPIFLYLLDWEIHLALLGSLILVWMVSLGSRLAHQQGGHADKEWGVEGIKTALPGTIIGTVLSALLIIYLSELAIKVFSAVILAWVIYMAIGKFIRDKSGDDTEYNIPKPQGELLMKYQFACFGAGASSGLLGIGGGALFVTTNRSLLHFNSRRSAGTSYIIESWMVPTGVLAHLFIDGSGPSLLQEIGLQMAILIPLMVLGSAFFGAKVAINNFSLRFLTIVFIAAVSLSLLRYLLDFTGLL